MDISRALSIRDSMLTRVSDLHSLAQICYLSSEEFNTKFEEILNPLTKGIPYWVKAYVTGFHKAKIDELYRRHLVFGGYIGDTFYSTHFDRPDYYGNHFISAADYADNGRVKRRGHYWINNTKKHFFISELCNREG